MRRLLGLVLVLSVPASVPAADHPGRNLLTPAELRDGWILLFDGETTFGWHSPTGSRWMVAGGMLAPQSGTPGLLVNSTAFGDCELTFDFRTRPGTQPRVLFGCDRDGRPDGARVVTLRAFREGWSTVSLRYVRGLVQVLTFTFPGRAMIAPVASQGTPRPVGYLALSGNGVIFRNIKLKPLGLQCLFNGKNLAGWKEFKGPGKKSQFSVTPEGWLHIKNGPGDLQTKGQCADFVLQLECISNGQHLNSGVFFRCRPDEYQQGYEAQIRNQFTDKPTQPYIIEEYDPATHKRKGTRKVHSTAVDYGTGAIYRRVPARGAVARDHEWFTLTVVARGRHLATWVNGIQQVDWTDNRPLSDNARQGCRLEKGPISLQGHDPTTDLNFRNIRIADLGETGP